MSNRKAKFVQIFPGCMHIKGFLTKEEQIAVTEIANEEQSKFYSDKEKKTLNSAKTRGRIYDAVENYPNAKFLTKMCVRAAEESHRKDASIRVVAPTHLLMLLYTKTKGMGYHCDDGENDGDEDYPIISLNVGNTCVFGFKDNEDNEKTIVWSLAHIASVFKKTWVERAPQFDI